jgi:hypothetical protein
MNGDNLAPNVREAFKFIEDGGLENIVQFAFCLQVKSGALYAFTSPKIDKALLREFASMLSEQITCEPEI